MKSKAQVEITTHEGHPAVNVKVRGSLYRDGVDQTVLDRAYDLMVEMWWDEAARVSHKHGYTGVMSEGRSGGWCVPYYQSVNGKLQKHGGNYPQSSGQGPDRGYPSYVEAEDSKERRTFAEFERDICKLLKDVPQMFDSAVESIQESNGFEAGKRAAQQERERKGACMPDLLEAARWALDNLDAALRGNRPPHNDIEVGKKLRNAILKAEG